MNIINLEIDSRIKELLQTTLSGKNIIGISFNSTKPKPPVTKPDHNLAPLDYSYTMTVKIYAEAEAIGKIVKTLVRLGRDGLTEFPIKVLSIMQLNPC